MSSAAARRAGGKATAARLVSCDCIYCGEPLLRPVNRAAHAACDVCKRRNKAGRAPAQRKERAANVLYRMHSDPGPYPLCAGLPMGKDEIESMCKLGCFNENTIVRHCSGRLYRVTGAAGTAQGLEQVTAADYMTGAHTTVNRKDKWSGMVRLVAGHVVVGGAK